MEDTSIDQKPKNKKRFVLGIIAGIIIFAAAIAGTVFGLSLLGVTPNSQPKQVVNPLRENVDNKATFDKDTVGKFGFFEVKINKVTREYNPPGGVLPQKDGYVFLLLNISAKNTDSKPHLLSDIDLAVLSDDVVINSSFIQVKPAIKAGSVEPGKTVTGNLLYEVPAGKDDLKLYYNTKIYDETDKKLEKNEYILAF